ncbi:MAG TPA: hypothetical protein VMV44_07385 [Rectinemataceae bacterium]|nr:hypothetical protein [Rectinemataceae bacterium]
MIADRLADLLSAMEREIAAFDACVAVQKEFSEAVEKRDWPGLETSMGRLDDRFAEIHRVETLRSDAETLLRNELGAPGTGIPSLLFLVPEPSRSLLSDMHRQLRVAAMRVRLENGSIGDYARANRNLLGEVLRELFPDKKGKIYGRSGRAVEPGHDAILLNTAM